MLVQKISFAFAILISSAIGANAACNFQDVFKPGGAYEFADISCTPGDILGSGARETIKNAPQGGYETYGAPNPAPVQQGNPVSADCPNTSAFAPGKCFDNNWKEIVRGEPQPQPSTRTTNSKPIQLNPDIKDPKNWATLSPGTSTPSTPSSSPGKTNTSPSQSSVTGTQQPSSSTFPNTSSYNPSTPPASPPASSNKTYQQPGVTGFDKPGSTVFPNTSSSNPSSSSSTNRSASLSPGTSTPSNSPTIVNPYRYQSQVTGFQQPSASASTTNKYTAVVKAVRSGMAPRAAWATYVGGPTFSVGGIAPRYAVGGISLTKAAAERMPLNLDIDALTMRDGQIVLSGNADSKTGIDAGLFLTALRTACLPYDPYFSLDPVDGAAWDKQGQEAATEIWDRVKDEFRQQASNDRFSIDTFSVKQRYPMLWEELAPRYPELRTRLVFRPEWLRQTRFGEILYKADVLLKELSSGVSVLRPGAPLRAERVPGYIPSDQRSVARNLLITDASKKMTAWEGHRLWFDFMPTADGKIAQPFENPDSQIDRRERSALYAVLRDRGFVDGPMHNPVQKTAFYSNDSVTDLSEVYPKMFIRRHDSATNKDLPGSSPDLDLLSNDVNERTRLYVNAYEELRALTDVFRAYVASVKIVKDHKQLCTKLGPLSDGEKLSTPLPEFHPSELFITVARATWRADRRQFSYVTTGRSINGGIAVRGKAYFAAAATPRETPITKEVNQDLRDGIPAPAWKAKSGREYVAFNMDPREPPRRVPVVADGQ